MNYANDEFYWINTAPIRVHRKGQHPSHVYLATVGYYYKGEVFRSTPLFPGIMVGNYGTVYDFRGFKIEPRIERGYYVVTVFSVAKNRYKPEPVHRLIMIAHDFIENYEEMEVNHKDGNKLNDIFLGRDHPGTNLEWCTHEENTKHAHRTGLCYTKYPLDLIKQLLDLMRAGYTEHQAVNMVDSKFSKHEIGLLLHRILYKGAFSYLLQDYQDVINSAPNHPKNYNLPDETIHKICKLALEKESVDEIMRQTGLMDRPRRGVISFIAKLKRNGHPKYEHITRQYFSSKNIIKVNKPKNKRKTAIPEETLRAIMDNLRNGYSRKEAVERCGYSYDNSMKNLVSGMLREGAYQDIQKDYPDVVSAVNRNIELPNHVIHNICKMILQGSSVDDIMFSNNITDDRTKVRDFLLRLKHNKSARYENITRQYFNSDTSLPGARKDIPENIVHEICRLDIQGKRPSEIAAIVNTIHLDSIAISRLLYMFRRNISATYKHITSQYYK